MTSETENLLQSFLTEKLPSNVALLMGKDTVRKKKVLYPNYRSAFSFMNDQEHADEHNMYAALYERVWCTKTYHDIFWNELGKQYPSKEPTFFEFANLFIQCLCNSYDAQIAQVSVINRKIEELQAELDWDNPYALPCRSDSEIRNELNSLHEQKQQLMVV